MGVKDSFMERELKHCNRLEVFRSCGDVAPRGMV